jgi:hypothetical protein
VNFRNPLYWVTKYQPGKITGTSKGSPLISDHVNLYGEHVIITIGPVVSSPNTVIIEEEHAIRFFWEPQSLVRSLWITWAGSQPFSLPLPGLGLCRFCDTNPITAVPVVGEDWWDHERVPQDSYVDKYNGEIRVIAARVL